MNTTRRCDICGVSYNARNTKNSKNHRGFVFKNIEEFGKYLSDLSASCCPDCVRTIKRRSTKDKRGDRKLI